MISYNRKPLHNRGGKRSKYFVCGILIQEALHLTIKAYENIIWEGFGIRMECRFFIQK